ncbi:MAG TPA: crossover junction endodeoxyribonuclease RuvC [Spirochaetota bacterium]|nr:crossover junction endodeoxyribonuclease RuvC [Spirochaetota bacterium]
MKILGIDPGYDILGWSVISDNFKVHNYGIIKTSPAEPFEARLLKIHRSLDAVIADYLPDCASIEKLFFQKNSKTVMHVSAAIGVVMLTLKLKEIPFYEYTPTQVKNSITGFGKAEKGQVEFMIKRILNLGEINGPDDAADALSIAVCHALCRKPGV